NGALFRNRMTVERARCAARRLQAEHSSLIFFTLDLLLVRPPVSGARAPEMFRLRGRSTQAVTYPAIAFKPEGGPCEGMHPCCLCPVDGAGDAAAVGPSNCDHAAHRIVGVFHRPCRRTCQRTRGR